MAKARGFHPQQMTVPPWYHHSITFLPVVSHPLDPDPIFPGKPGASPVPQAGGLHATEADGTAGVPGGLVLLTATAAGRFWRPPGATRDLVNQLQLSLGSSDVSPAKSMGIGKGWCLKKQKTTRMFFFSVEVF